jgi:hypothetical protein
MAIGTYCHIQKDYSKKRKLATSVEIVDVPRSVVENEITLKSDNLKDGTVKLTKEDLHTIKLTKEDLHQLFQFRNLAFLATLSKNVAYFT